jgi:hypothetical protein
MTDFLTKVVFPMNQDGVRETFYKVVTLPATPRVTDEVFMPGERFLPVTKLRFRQDQRVELWFEDVWPAIQWDFSNIPALRTALTDGGYGETHVWDNETPPA